MAQTTLFSVTVNMIKTIPRRRSFILLAIFVLVVILTAIINSNNGANTVINSNNHKYRPRFQKFSDDPDDEFLKLPPNNFAKHDGDTNSIKRLQNSLDEDEKRSIRTKQKTGYVPEKRIVHFDLKGAAPKVGYLNKIFSLIAKAGATGIMLEWEDMFPFEGDLEAAKHEYAYTKEDVTRILEAAKKNKLEVIPLIQAFGHLEYFLKLQEYRSLRELDLFPQAICPSKPEAFELVTKIIDQVMSLHKDVQFIHIGCDEVFQLGSCDQCRKTNRDELFLNHVTSVAKFVNRKYKINSIMWDDMLRQFSDYTLKKYDFERIGLEVMVWTYIDDIYRFIPQETWYLYSQFFPHIWGASAFKGAFGETLIVPNAKMHMENNFAWLRAMQQLSDKINFRGLVITGWQRYDHLGNLCELLPVGIPSLITDLLTAKNGYYHPSIFHQFDDLLGCESGMDGDVIDVKNDPHLFLKRFCRFPGSEVFRLMQNARDLIKRVDDYLYDVTTHKAWLTQFNEAHNITNPFRIQEALQNYYSLYSELKQLVKDSYYALIEIFEKYTALEWIEQKLYPSIRRMERFYNRTQKLDKLRVWPRRPVQTVEDLKRFIPKDKNVDVDKNEP